MSDQSVDGDIRSRIFNYKSLNYQPATFCGVEVVVVGMSTGKRREILGPAMESVAGGQSMSAGTILERVPRIIQECVRYSDDHNKKVFNNNPADLEYINSLPPYEIDPIVKLAITLSGENWSVIEALIKNSKKESGP